MRLLLDTHIWLWGLLSPQRLSRKVAAALEDPGHELWLSSISVWEALVLAERGRIELDSPPADWVALQLSRVPMRDAPVTRDVAIRSRTVSLAHDDPADRFIAATAGVHSLTLVTGDERLAKGSGYSVLVNRSPRRRPGLSA